MRFLSGAGELLWGGLVSGAWAATASGSGAVGVSPSGGSLVKGSTDSTGEPGGRSEQVLMVRARRRCWPMCVRFREKLFLFLDPLTFAGFIPGSSLISRSGCKRQFNVTTRPLCLQVTCYTGDLAFLQLGFCVFSRLLPVRQLGNLPSQV